MSRFHKQEGSGLIVLLGVIATVAVLATVVAMVTVNTQAGTAATRTQAKSFYVAEAGLDFSTYALDATWPTTSGQALNTTTIANTAMGSLDAATFPGASITLHLYDNSDTNGDGVIGYGPNGWDAAYDANGDGTMWADSQSVVQTGTRVAQKSRVRVQVTSVAQSGGLTGDPTVLWTGGQVSMSGPDLGIAVAPPAGGVHAYIGGAVINNNPPNVQSGVTVVANNTTVPITNYMPTSTYNTLMTSATTTTGNSTVSSISYSSGSHTTSSNTTVTGSVSITGSATHTFNGSLYINGTLTIGTSGTVTFNGPVYVTGNMTVNSSFSGTIQNNVGGSNGGLLVVNGDFSKAGGGYFGSEANPFLLMESDNGRNLNFSGGDFYGIIYGKYANFAPTGTGGGSSGGAGSGGCYTNYPLFWGSVFVAGVGNFNTIQGYPYMVRYDDTVVQNLGGFFSQSAPTSVQLVTNTWQEMKAL
jgi:hypothetical protein